MKLKLILVMAVVGTALALPSVSSAAPPPPPPPQQDSVTGHARFLDSPCTNKFNCGEVVGIDAHSGPSGESPSGGIGVTILVSPVPGVIEPGPSFGFQVTCLNVQGNRATIGASGDFESTLISVEDNGGAGLDRFSSTFVVTAPTQCPAPPARGTGQVVADGHFAVHDAQPLPTTRDQCMNGSWKQIGFANQGLCLAFVERGP